MAKNKRFRKVVQWEASEQAETHGFYVAVLAILIFLEFRILFLTFDVAGDTGLPWTVIGLIVLTMLFIVYPLSKLSENIKRKVWWEEI